MVPGGGTAGLAHSHFLQSVMRTDCQRKVCVYADDLISVIPFTAYSLHAISIPAISRERFIQKTKKLHPASAFSDRLLQCSFSFFSLYSVRIFHPGQLQPKTLASKRFTTSGAHIQVDCNPKRSHPGCSHPSNLPYCSFRSPLRYALTSSFSSSTSCWSSSP